MKKLFSLAALLLLCPALGFSQVGVIAPITHPVFTLANGVTPAALGFVCTTSSGTSTPLATYYDSDLDAGHANQNPVHLSAVGRAINGSTLVDIFLQAATYRITLYAAGTGNTCNGTAVGTLIWQSDDIAGDLSSLSFVTRLDDKVCHAAAYTSLANGGAKIAQCISVLPSTGGSIDVRGLQGAQTIATNIFSGITKPIDIICSGATFTWSTTSTIPANVTWHFGTGCTFTGTGPLTFNGKVSDPQNQQIFTTTLGLNLCGGNSPYPEWFGGKPDNSTDNHAAIQAAIDSFVGCTSPYAGLIGPTGGGWNVIRGNPGAYRLATGVVVQNSGTRFQGCGYSCTIFRFAPTATGVLLTFKTPDYPSAMPDTTSSIHDNGISDLTLDAYGSSQSYVKTALLLEDVVEFQATNFKILQISDATKASIGWDIHGREKIHATNCYVFASIPVNIGADLSSATEGLDESEFDGCFFAAVMDDGTPVLTKPVIQITEANALLSNVSFTNYDFLYGSYSVYWTASNALRFSGNVSFQHGRNEGGPVANWAYYIAPTGTYAQIFGLGFDDVSVGSATKGGWYLRQVYNGSMNNVTYNTLASIAVLDADYTVSMSYTNANLNLHTATNYTAFNDSCGLRYGLDKLGGGDRSTGDVFLRSCGTSQLILESAPGGTTYTISAGSCSGNQFTYTTSSQSFLVGGTVNVTGVVPAGFNGRFDITAVPDATHVTVTNDQCAGGIAAYSSGGANSLTYGPQAYIGTNSGCSGQVAGDLCLRSDGAAIQIGRMGTTYIEQRSTGLVLLGATPTVAASQVGFGMTVVAAGSGNCPTTITTNAGATAPAGCLVINVAGTTRVLPYF